MIQSKSELKRILKLEEQFYHKKWYYHLPFAMTEQQVLYKHARLLRKAEYAANTRRISRVWYLFLLLRIQTRYGISIPLNVLDEGFEIVHLGSIIINAGSRIGKWSRLHPGVCVGANHEKAPKIGDYAYLGPGAKVFGDIVLADHIQVGANAVVTKSCRKEGAVLVGIPAVDVSEAERMP